MRCRLGAGPVFLALLACGLCERAIAQPGAPAPAQLNLPHPLTGRPELLADPTMNLPAARTARPSMLPDSVPEAESSSQFVLGIEYKNWRPRRQAADFGIVDPNVDTTPEGPIESLRGTPSSAFRASVGYKPGGSPWELAFAYTFFRSRDAQSLTAPAGGLLFATQTRPGLIETADTATATTHWKYDLYDLEMGRNYMIDAALGLRAQVGVRVANIGLDSLVLYDGRDAAMARVASGFQFTGAGLLVGGETHWTLGGGLSLFGRARGGIVFGANSSYLRETQNDGTAVQADVSDRSPQSVPFVEMGIGAAWHAGKWSIRGGYDVANWFQLINTPDFADDVHKGKISARQSNLSFDGFFVQVGYSY